VFATGAVQPAESHAAAGALAEGSSLKRDKTVAWRSLGLYLICSVSGTLAWSFIAMRAIRGTFFNGGFSLDPSQPYGELSSGVPEAFVASAAVTGLYLGIFVYGVWNSERRRAILTWMLPSGVSGFTIGWIVSDQLESIGGLDSKMLSLLPAERGIRVAVVLMVTSLLFVSSRRRYIAKALLASAALGSIMRLFLYSVRDFSPHSDTLATRIAVEPGADAAIPLFVAVGFAIMQRLRKQRTS